MCKVFRNKYNCGHQSTDMIIRCASSKRKCSNATFPPRRVNNICLRCKDQLKETASSASKECQSSKPEITQNKASSVEVAKNSTRSETNFDTNLLASPISSPTDIQRILPNIIVNMEEDSQNSTTLEALSPITDSMNKLRADIEEYNAIWRSHLESVLDKVASSPTVEMVESLRETLKLSYESTDGFANVRFQKAENDMVAKFEGGVAALLESTIQASMRSPDYVEE